MQKINIEVCNCDFMVDMTFCDTFAALDQTLVDSVNEMISSTYSALYIGDYSSPPSNNLLLAESLASGQEPGRGTPETKIIPISLLSGQTLSLLANSECSEEQLMDLRQILTVYQNQHEHLNRANKDKLTSLKNRRAFDAEYEHLTESGSSSVSGHILAVIDIDFFKNINDKYGHLVGDETLIALSNLMKEFFIREDHLYRFGGEEFVVLIQNCTVASADKQLNELRLKIAEYAFAQIGKMTVSIGFIQLEPGVDNNLLFERADAAMYNAKESGRNCVKNYEALIEHEIIKPVVQREGEIELF